jgi:type VI secretion system protein ImpL
MIKYIVCALLVTLAWGLVLAFSHPLWWAVAATGFILVVLLCIVGWQQWRAQRASKAIEEALRKQAAQQLAQGRPDLQQEIEAMQQEFSRGVAALKQTNVAGRTGAKALYALPWYVIIGPPGAGKTTALRNCGLEFPYVSGRGRGGALQGIGGTRNCDWWMSNHAILLDTAGRYTTHNEDRDEWLAFLDLLRKNRPQRPINGVIVAIPASDLGLADGVEPGTAVGSQLATDLRARIDETIARLDVSVPVYLLVTKCDLIPGFVETFSALDRNERNQIWGFTLPIERPQGLVGEIVARHFDELTGLLGDRCLQRLTAERNEAAKGKIFEFPQHFAILRDRLAGFAAQLTADTVYSEVPRLRGVYFTSGTQEGRTINRIAGAVARAMGLPNPASPLANVQPTESRAYFLSDVFFRVMFPDRLAARRSRAHQRKIAKAEWMGAAGLCAASIGIVALPTGALRKNVDLQGEATAAVESIASLHASNGNETISMKKVLPLLNVIKTLDEHERDGVPVGMRMGMYQGKTLRQPLRDLLLATINSDLVAPLLAQDSDNLRRFADKHIDNNSTPDDERYRQNFATLRRYLHLTQSEADDGSRPVLQTPEEREWLAMSLAAAWERPLTALGEGGSPEELRQLSDFYVDALANETKLDRAQDQNIVEDSRRVLRRIHRDQALILQIVEDLSREEMDITLRSIMNTGFVANGNRLVRGAFTRQGWEKHVRERLEAAANTPDSLAWVVGHSTQDAQSARKERLAALRGRYFELYIEEWQNFLGSMVVSSPSDYGLALQLFTELTRGPTPPLRALFEHVRWNSALLEAPKPKAEDLLDKAAEKAGEMAQAKIDAKTSKGLGAELGGTLGESETEQGQRTRYKVAKDVVSALSGFYRFGAVDVKGGEAEGPSGAPGQALEIDDYQAVLMEVRDALRARIDDPNQETALNRAVKSARTKVQTLIESQDPNWKPRFSDLLWPPFERMTSLVEGQQKEGVARSWCNQVYFPMQEALGGRYPFAKEARADASLADLTRLLHPETGEIWKYHQGVLSGLVPRDGSNFRLAERGSGDRWKVNSDVPSFFMGGIDVAETLFPRGRPAPLVEFEVLIAARSGISEIALSIDGQSLVYRNGPETWHPMSWPGEGEQKGASVRAKGFGRNGHVEESGEWGLFRLFEQGKIEGSAGAQVFTVTWDLTDQGAGPVSIKIKPRRRETPFFGQPSRATPFLGVFRTRAASPPDSIIEGGSPCSQNR